MGTPVNQPLIESRHAGGFIVSTSNGHQSIDQIVLSGTGQVTNPQGMSGILAGTVLGLSTALSYTAPQDGVGETQGNGTIGAVVLSSPAVGTFSIALTSATAFTVTDPTGATSAGVVGTAFSALGVAFTITAGTSAFVAGDAFAIHVNAASSTYFPLNLSASDGTQTAAAILYDTKYMTTAVVAATAVTRHAEVNASEILWPATATAAQIATGISQLKALGLLAR